ncbi:hypothetical protein [Mesorhizobium sp. M1273]|uniref:hypothetical protein n=1 Tax=Mesorhizobium sp. M1273 TaxID=2957075 RepID=UPI00333588F2
MLYAVSAEKLQVNPTAAARCRLSCTVLRAIPNMTAISRELVPPPASSICLNCLMVSPLFAGIKISPFTAGHLMPKLLTQEVIFSAENWPVFDWNAGRLQIGTVARSLIGMAAGFASEIRMQSSALSTPHDFVEWL